ncbi:MAG TPA: nucleotidyltransferase domain-containing protein [Candidatus Nanoarchaeia archaeon]|nr:nucleotidyltransferase domain-containing protein [Candidatus Nanoarchaeia archaeon]
MAENNEIPEMNLGNKYQHIPKIPQDMGKMQKETEKKKKELDKLKSFILKKYPFTQSLGIIPPQSIKTFIDEEELGINTQSMQKEDVEKIQKKIHIQMIVPEDKFKEIPKIRAEIIKYTDSTKQDIWLHIKTPVDVWEICLDSKFDVASAIAMSYPLYDKGFLGALRVAEIHKNLVLNKFERYVVSYVVAGSLVRGEAIKTSDVDVFIVINDTDVKRMPRLELKERLRSMIYQYVSEAEALAGVKNKLSPQIYLLTEFWDSVKDANPVIFTFIRDGIPLYDRGTFMPWKSLLKMGKLKPSPEAIDMFMRTAERTKDSVNRRLIDAMIDIYYGVLTPSQALIMLYGLPPPTPKETAKQFENIFVDKEKMLKKSEITILERAVKEFKAYEHDLKYTVEGKVVDEMKKESEEFLKRLKELRGQIEKTAQERTIEQINKDVFNLIEEILGKKSQEKILESFEKELVKKGKISPQSLRTLRELINVRKEFKKGKTNAQKVDDARKNSALLINELVEYSQRKDLVNFEKSRIRLKYSEQGKEKTAELIIAENEAYLIKDNQIRKITDKIENSDFQELTKSVERQKSKQNLKFNGRVFDILKKDLGNFEVVL